MRATTTEREEGRAQPSAGAAAASDDATLRLAAALEHLHQGVVITDQQGEVVFRNQEAAAYVGARRSEVLAERAVSELLESALAGQPQEQIVELFAPPRRSLDIRALPLVVGGRTLGAAAIVEDISDRRRLDAIRRDFVANISHELKTPVGALCLIAETLEGEDDPANVARLTDRMRAEAERLGRIIEDLLDLSRLEAEEAEDMVRTEAVPVHLVIAQAVDRLRPLAEHRGITIEAPEPPHNLVVEGDRLDLVSAVFNLVDNAIKYSESGSPVQVEAEAADDGSTIEIRVVDHGIGIPSQDLERIFERFYRVDRARSRVTGGTGLGLAIARHVAANHGGDVRVTSVEGSGSTFTLRLPSWSAAAEMSRRDADAGSGDRGRSERHG